MGDASVVPPFKIGSLWVDVGNLVVRGQGDAIPLTPLEAKVLAHLWRQRGQAVSHRSLLSDVWGYAPTVETRAPHHTVTRLRRKLAADPAALDCLRNVHGHGYALHVTELAEESSFVGRAHELELLKRMASERRIVTVTGPAGIGKTALVRHFATLDGCPFVWVACADSPVREALARSLELDQGDEVSATLQSMSATRVVLDGVPRGSEDTRRALQAWRSAASRISWIVTSRQPVGVTQEYRMPVGPLPADDADVLFDMLRHRRFPGHDAPRGEGLGGVPLALEQAAHHPTQCQDRQCDTALHDALHDDWEHLEHRERTALARCCTFVSGFGMEAAEAVLDDHLSALDRLEETSWVTKEADGSYRVLPHIRAFASDRLGNEARDEHQRRHAMFFARWGERAALDEVAVSTPTRHALAEARPDLRAAMQWARSAGAWNTAARTWLGWHGLIRHGETAFDAEAYEEIRAQGTDPGLGARMTSMRGDHRRLAGQLLQAQNDYIEAMQQFATLEDSAAVAIEQCNVGACLCGLRDLEESVAWFNKARDGFRNSGDVRREGRVLFNCGAIAVDQGYPDKAQQAYREALSRFVACDDSPMQAKTYYMLGLMHSRSGAFELGRAYINNALELARAEQLEVVIVHCHIALGNLHHNLGDQQAATEAYETAAADAERLDLDRVRSVVLGNLGMLRHRAGNLPGALAAYEEGLAIVSHLEDPLTTAIASSRLGHLQVLSGARGPGEALLDQAEAAFTTCADEMHRAAHWCRRAEAASNRLAAEDWARRAQEAAERLELEASSPLWVELERVQALLRDGQGPS